MESKFFLRFLRAEAAGYPVLLIVSVVALATVVAPVALLGITGSGWALALAVVGLAVALAILAAAIHTAFSDDEDPAPGREACGSAPGEQDPPVIAKSW